MTDQQSPSGDLFSILDPILEPICWLAILGTFLYFGCHLAFAIMSGGIPL